MKSEFIQIKKPSDMHVHLRQKENLKYYVKASAENFDYAVVMPNIVPPVRDAVSLSSYRTEIEKFVETEFKPLMTFKIFEGMDDEEISALKEEGAVAGKLYPKGVTTNSDDGASDFKALYPVFKLLEKYNIILSIHGEDPDAPVFERERAFLPVFKQIIDDFPGLKVVLEHVSTEESVRMIEESRDGVAATITALHLASTTDDLLGRGLSPHFFCKPIVQSEKDRQALVKAAVSGNPKFFFGSDSAPHLKESKESFSGAAGVFSALTAVPVVAGIFEEAGRLEALENFLSVYGPQFYGMKVTEENIVLERTEYIVENNYHGVVPFYADKTLNWKIKRR